MNTVVWIFKALIFLLVGLILLGGCMGFIQMMWVMTGMDNWTHLGPMPDGAAFFLLIFGCVSLVKISFNKG